MLDRRRMIAALAGWPAGRLLAQEQPPRPRHRISAGELHRALSERFPVRLGVPSVLQLELDAPRLHLLPARQKIGAMLLAQVSAGQPQIDPGEMDIVFALRYEPADQTVRAHDMEILELRWPGLPPQTLEAVRRLLPVLAREAMLELVLHRFTPRELALTDTMGFEPEKLVIEHDGLAILFGPKRVR